MGETSWSMVCGPPMLWAAEGAWSLETGASPELPGGSQPVGAANGVIITADDAGERISLTVASKGQPPVANYELGRPYGPISAYASDSGYLAAMDVAPPDDRHLAVWTRSPAR